MPAGVRRQTGGRRRTGLRGRKPAVLSEPAVTFGLTRVGTVPRRGIKKIDRSAHIGDSAGALIHTRVSEMGFVWHDRTVDAGNDGSIELRDPATGEVNNRHFFVQSRGRDNRFSGENDRGLHYLCRPDDGDYWMRSTTPVLLVCSHPATGEAWWVHVRGWFADPGRRASGRVEFDKATQRLDASCASRFLALADPHGDAYVPVAALKSELLTSNLVAVMIPSTVYPSPGRRAVPGRRVRSAR